MVVGQYLRGSDFSLHSKFMECDCLPLRKSDPRCCSVSSHLSPPLAQSLLVEGLQEHDEKERGGDAEAEQDVASQVQCRVEVGVARG